MEKLLQQYEADSCGSPKFWGKVRPEYRVESETVKISGMLRTQGKNNQWKTRQYSLTQDHLFRFKPSSFQSLSSSQVSKKASISWKRVEAFTEDMESAPQFGFRLIRGLNSCDFYVDTSRELEEWLDRLQEVAIMTDFENDYLIEKEIGRGNYATVYEGRQQLDGRKVAIKRLHKHELETSPRATLALINEVNLMKRLKHKRILCLLSIYEDDDRLYLILEYAGGGDLFHRILEKGHFSEAKSALFMHDFLDAINYMHKQGVVHRDLKPENILLMSKESDLDFKVADFGLASSIRSGEELSMRCGSPGYVAPEILEKRDYGFKVDVFSAGIILYILYHLLRLSGRSPFASEDINEVLSRNKACNIFFQQKYWSKVSQEGVNLVIHMTEKRPARRPTAEEALEHAWFTATLTHESPLKSLGSTPTVLPHSSPK